jgi:hypothetical protein
VGKEDGRGVMEINGGVLGSGLMFWSSGRPDLVCADHGSAMANRIERETRSLGDVDIGLGLTVCLGRCDVFN